MSRREINMTEGNLWRQMFQYSVPLMFSNVLQVLFHMSDVAPLLFWLRCLPALSWAFPAVLMPR